MHTAKSASTELSRYWISGILTENNHRDYYQICRYKDQLLLTLELEVVQRQLLSPQLHSDPSPLQLSRLSTDRLRSRRLLAR